MPNYQVHLLHSEFCSLLGKKKNQVQCIGNLLLTSEQKLAFDAKG